MTRKLIITIQFILVGILCIGCSGKQKEPNIREAQIIELSQEQVSIDENLQLSILLNNTIHLIDMTYYDIFQYTVSDKEKEFFFANIQNYFATNPLGVSLIFCGFIVQNAIPSLVLGYYQNTNVFYIANVNLDVDLFMVFYNNYFSNSKNYEKIGIRQYKLYKAICNTPRATMDEIVNILEEEL